MTKAPQVAASGAPKKKHSKPQFSEKSTTVEAQREHIVRMLRMRPHNFYKMCRAGAYLRPTRVFELRQWGWEIVTSRGVVIDADGYEHRFVARYKLIIGARAFLQQFGGAK